MAADDSHTTQKPLRRPGRHIPSRIYETACMTKAEPTQTTDHLRDQELICSAGAVPSWGIYPSLLKAMAAARAEERERCAQKQVVPTLRTTEIEELIARAILRCAINDVGREYPDWDSATAQNREIALKCAVAAIGALYGNGYQILPCEVVKK